MPTPYYCFSVPRSHKDFDKDTWSIEDFELKDIRKVIVDSNDTGEEDGFDPITITQAGRPVSLYKDKNEAARAMREQQGKQKSGSDYRILIKVSVKEELSDQITMASRINSYSPVIYDFLSTEITPLSAELYSQRDGTTFMESERYTADGIKHLLKYPAEVNGYEEVIGSDNEDKIEAILKSLLKSFPNDESKQSAWKRVEQQTNLLLAEILKIPLKKSVAADLDLIQRGVDLSWAALNDPNEKSVEQLKSFVEKEASGKTNYWIIWGGALLAVAALAAFIVLTVASSGALAIAASAAGALAIGTVGGYGSFFGKQHGFAKVGSDIVEQAENELKNKKSD